jgi:hypothetical protein
VFDKIKLYIYIYIYIYTQSNTTIYLLCSEAMFFSSLACFCDVALWGFGKIIYLFICLFNYTFFLALFQTQLKLQSGMLQRTNATTNSCINRIRMLQRTNATTNSFINRIRMLQRTRRNTISRRSTRVRMTCRAFPLWVEGQSSYLLSFVRFSYRFSSVICLFEYLAVKIL